MMKMFMMLSFLLLATPVWASPFVQSNLEVGMMVSGVGSHKKRGKIAKCGRLSGKIEPRSVDRYAAISTAGEKRIQQTGELRIDAWAGPFITRSLTLQTRFETKNEVETVEVNLKDQQVRKYNYHNAKTCSVDTMNYAADQDFMRGRLRIGYRMPKNTWAVIVKRKSFDGMLSPVFSNDGKMVSLNTNHQTGAREALEVIWGAPDTDVYQEFTYDDKNSVKGSEVTGQFSIEFHPLVSKNDKLVATEILFQKLSEASIEFSKLEDEESIQKNKGLKRLELVKQILGITSSPENIKKFVSYTSLEDIRKTTQLLTAITLSPDSGQYNWDLKAAAVMLSHEVALSFLEEVAPYCSTTSIKLPHTGENVEVLGLKLATYLLDRARRKIDSHNFEYLRALLDAVYKWEKEGLTYAQVRNSAEKFKQLKDAYTIIRNTVDLSSTPYAVAKKDITTFRSKFSVGPASVSSNKLINDLDGLSQMEKQFQNVFLELLREFNSSNQKRIDTSKIGNFIASMEDTRIRAITELDINFRFLSSSSNPDPTNFLGLMVEMITQNVGALNGEMQSEFRFVRDGFVNKERSAKVLGNTRACIQ